MTNDFSSLTLFHVTRISAQLALLFFLLFFLGGIFYCFPTVAIDDQQLHLLDIDWVLIISIIYISEPDVQGHYGLPVILQEDSLTTICVVYCVISVLCIQ